MDTVPEGDPARWSRDPLDGGIVADRIVGRGASHMKGGLAACVTALAAAARNRVPCGLLLTTDEETGCHGARAAADVLRPIAVGAVVVPESTDNNVLLGHRGALWIRLTVRGVAAYGSTPYPGRNALIPVAAAALDAETNLPVRRHPVLGATTVNVGTMSAGVAPNIVPDRAEAGFDVRYVDAAENLAPSSRTPRHSTPETKR